MISKHHCLIVKSILLDLVAFREFPLYFLGVEMRLIDQLILLGILLRWQGIREGLDLQATEYLAVLVDVKEGLLPLGVLDFVGLVLPN